jgi:acyl-CoA reductase-like NAD-dependent aldehyde dehydrogenase
MTYPARSRAGHPTHPASLSEPTRIFVERPHRLLIGGERVSAVDGRTFPTIDPATGRPVAQIPLAAAEDVDRAVVAARRALAGEWSALSAADRGLLMQRLAGLLEDHAEELAEIESLDNGKPLTMARTVDLPGAIAHLCYFAGWPTKIEGETIPVAGKFHCYTRLEPVGVCGQIVPWNFPLVMAMWKIAPALAAGCAVVLKPAEQTPLSALRLGELALEAGIPAGVLNVVTGDGKTGAALVDHSGVDKIAFTGSTAVGREIGAKAGATLKRVTLELGGKSANVILPDADMEAAVAGSYRAIYRNSGQTCNAGSRLFVPANRFDDVVSELAATARSARIGPGLDPETELGPLVSAEQRDRVERYVEAGRSEGAELVAGGDRVPGEGYFVEPTLFTATRDDLAIAREEIFGPVLVASPYRSLDEVVERANGTPYGLAAGVWTRDLASAHSLAAQLTAGSIYVNGWGPVDPAAPFGGFKASGLGREHGRAGLEAYLERKTVWVQLG